MNAATQVAAGAVKLALGSPAPAPRIENLAVPVPRTGFGALPLWVRLQISIALILIVVWSLMIYLTYPRAHLLPTRSVPTLHFLCVDCIKFTSRSPRQGSGARVSFGTRR